MFDDQSKVLYVRLQYGSLLLYEIQEQEIPFIPIDLSRIIYCPNEGTRLDNVEMAFYDDWLLGHLLPYVLLGMDSFVLNPMDSTGLLPMKFENDSLQKTVPAQSRPSWNFFPFPSLMTPWSSSM
jgi:hypothetical protein